MPNISCTHLNNYCETGKFEPKHEGNERKAIFLFLLEVSSEQIGHFRLAGICMTVVIWLSLSVIADKIRTFAL